ncbi:monovalent cation/H+ antiporter subunit D [Pokkaliibacter sp. CJK22405]|uniref:monovalent cation/H+ antiporter subunit D n=1 Tax=Pokkaliibacter sp. CJK22405 TaxID=3384615 RepID=UPI0039854412
MMHLPIFPILLPLLVGVVMLLPPLSRSRNATRVIAVLSLLGQLALALWLGHAVNENGILHYALGDWQAPFGIALMVDKLSVLMLVVTAVLALGALLFSLGGSDGEGSFFHPLFQWQLLGLNGAFLTGDLFNLFVFFEVLLMASYGLMMHGDNRQRTRAALHYVILNLAGSSLFLFALGTLYASLGTLNMADMAAKIAELPQSNLPLVHTGGLLLMIVFALKAAVLPLHFWLPRTYSEAPAAVAALFAIMTKVGIYSLLRVFSLLFGNEAGPLAGIETPWLWPLALLTMAAGAIGALTSNNLRRLNAHLIVMSVGTILAVISRQSIESTSAALVYLVHSTLISGGLFLLAALIAEQRGRSGDQFVAGRPTAQPRLLGSLFIIGAMAMVGIPPFSGFVGKVLMMMSTREQGLDTALLWSTLLGASLVILVALSRAGSTLFWRVNSDKPAGHSAALPLLGVLVLLAAAPLITLFAGELHAYTNAIAQQLAQPQDYMRALLSDQGVTP